MNIAQLFLMFAKFLVDSLIPVLKGFEVQSTLFYLVLVEKKNNLLLKSICCYSNQYCYIQLKGTLSR